MDDPADDGDEQVVADDRIDLGGRVLTVIDWTGAQSGRDLPPRRAKRPPVRRRHDQPRSNRPHFPDSDLDTLVDSTRRLAERSDAVQLIFVHHYGHAVADKGFLGEVARVCNLNRQANSYSSQPGTFSAIPASRPDSSTSP